MARILIVSADHSLNENLQYKLRALGHTIITSSSKKGAVKEFKLSISENRGFQIIIIDQRVPDEDGFYIHIQDNGLLVINALRKKGRFQGLSIQYILLTDYSFNYNKIQKDALKNVINIPKGTHCMAVLIRKIYELEIKNLSNRFILLCMRCIPAFMLGLFIIVLDICNGINFSGFLISLIIFFFLGSYFLFIVNPSKRYSTLVKINDYEKDS